MNQDDAFTFFAYSIIGNQKEVKNMQNLTKANEAQQMIDMAEIDAIKDLEMVRMIAELLGDRLIISDSPRVNLLGADIALISQKARNLLNEIRYE